jgi:drug/metabolite transporter (DMT)-like permease
MIGEAAALAAAACWAVGSHLFGRVARDVPPGALNLAKCFTATAFFAATGVVTLGRAHPVVPPAALPWLLVSGVIGLALGDSAYFAAMATIGVRRALLLLSTAPVFAAIGGAIFLHEPLGLRELAAVATVMLGVVVVVNEQGGPLPRGLAVTPRATGLGVFWGLCAGLGQAAGSLLTRTAMGLGASSFDTALLRLCAGVVAMLVIAAASRRVTPWARALARPRLLAAIAGSAFVGTYLGMWLSQVAIGRASSTAIAATLLATSPIFALPLGRWLEKERVTIRALGGTALAVAGLCALTLGKT